MKHYTFIDNSKTLLPKIKGTVIFECDAESIADADELYTEATGKDPTKQPHIGCTIT